MRPLIRILVTLLALTMGGALVFALTFVGEKTQGPIEDAFTGAGNAIRKAEEKVILQRRIPARADKLKGLLNKKNNLRNPSDMLIGVYDDQENASLKPVFDLEKALHTQISLIHLYTAWGSKEEQQFPKIQVESIIKSGSLPFITWEPWLSDFDLEQFPDLRPVETRDVGGLKDVAAGVYDAYLHDWAKAAAEVGHSVFLRLGHEMNDPYRYPWGPQNNPASDFIAAWRHVHAVFEQEGATNVLWVWSPHPAYGWFDAYYPGEVFVDWVGAGVLNYGSVAHWSQWWTFDEIFGQHYPALAAFGKPIMLSEFGSLAVGGDRPGWYAGALRELPARYPLVKSIVFFHSANDRTITPQALDWTVIRDADCVREIRGALQAYTQQ